MKKRLLITMTALMLVTVTMMAVPAKPGLKKKVKKADGSTVELTLHGDEHYSFYKDATGSPFQIVNGFAKKITPEEVTTKWTARKKEHLNQGAANSRRANRVGEPINSTKGKHKGLVILLEFKDVKFSKSNVKEIYQRFFNEQGYNEGGMAGSVRDYFLRQSYDQLEINFDVVGPYSTAYDLEHYGAPVMENGEEKDHDRNAPLAMKEAVEHAILEPSLDFSDYDWDGNGVVDQVFIIFAGYSQAQGADANSIWPHESQLSGYNLAGKDKNGNSVAISTYGCASELSGDSGKDLDGIGTACHEFSHCLGLPDMYDTDYSGGYGMGYWDVMDGGSYLDSSRTPAGYTSYERWFSGWMEPVEIKELTQITDMKPLATHAEAYVLYNEGRKKDITGEYYLLENRQPVGFDAKLYGHGLLILHVDYNKNAWERNGVNDDPNHQHLTIIPADNEFGESSYRSLAGDPWPGVSGNTMLSNYTNPASTLYNANTDGSKLMNKQIDNITENPTEVQGVNTISFVACRPEMPVPSADEATEQVEGNSLTISWPAVEGATGYEIEVTTKGKPAKNPEQALQKAFTFDQFVTSSTGFTDVGSKLGSYGLSSWTGGKIFTSPKKMKIGTSKETGYLQSPNTLSWDVPKSTNITVAMGAEIADGTVTGSIDMVFANKGAKSWEQSDSKDFTITDKDTVLVYFEDVRKDYLRMTISPKKQMYLNYLAVYDGIWTAEQLGLKKSAAQAPRRAASTEIHSSPTNSYTLNNLDVNKIYIYRIRSLGEGGSFSAWSDEKTFDLETTGIQSISTKVNTDNTVRYFDLQGREVNGATKGLLIRKQGNNVTKVMVK